MINYCFKLQGFRKCKFILFIENDFVINVNDMIDFMLKQNKVDFGKLF